jgi:hypothetical protein
MASIPTLTSCSGSNANTNWTPTAIRTSVFDQTNPNYPRIWRLDSSYLTLSQGSSVAGIELSAILPALLALVPALTWPPIITAQPAAVTNAVPTASSSFSITASSEIAITYQWQVSVNGGAFSNLSNTGVYTNVTTATMNISSNNGLNGNQYQCIATNGSGSTTSAAVALTTDPAVLTYTPSSLAASVAHPAGTSFAITASHQTSATYQWAVNTGGGYADITSAGTPVYSGYTSATLAFTTSATSMNGYLYHCKVTDSNGTVTSSAFTLTVT